MSNTSNNPPIRAVRMGLFPTMNNLDDVVAMAMSKLPITTPNELMTILMVYQNTLIKQIEDSNK